MILVEEAMSGIRPVAFDDLPLALAAKGAHTFALRSLLTEDESLVCRLERDFGGKDINLTILADRDKWGEVVVIWPGAGEPLTVEVGKTVAMDSERMTGTEYWIISRAEKIWTGTLANLPDRIEAEYNTLCCEISSGVRVSYKEPVVAVTMIKVDGLWRSLAVPGQLLCAGEFSLAIYTPLTSFVLR
jgi:hypothetical protein